LQVHLQHRLFHRTGESTVALKEFGLEGALPIAGHPKLRDGAHAGDQVALVVAIAPPPAGGRTLVGGGPQVLRHLLLQDLLEEGLNALAYTGLQILLNGLFQLFAFHRAPPRVLCSSVGAPLNLHILPYATMLQSKKPKASRAQEIIAAFNEAGLETEWVEDVESILWEKLLVNAAINPLTALFNCPNGRLALDPTLQAILRDIVAEALPLVRPHGVKLSLDEAIARVETVCRATAENISSMLQDIRRGKRTEIDFINGAVVREGERLKQPPPLNRLLTALVERLSAH